MPRVWESMSSPVILRTDRSDTQRLAKPCTLAARPWGPSPSRALWRELRRTRLPGRSSTRSTWGARAEGVDEPLGVFRADRSRGSNEGPVLEAAFAAPLVGRDREARSTAGCLELGQAGIGRTVVISSGEPGVGESRLLATLRERVESDELRWLELRCTQLAVNTAFRPIADMVRRTTGLPSTATRTSSDAGYDVMPEALGEAGAPDRGPTPVCLAGLRPRK